ncbi:MAG: response regulator transcription factor [Chloroherpetonaceae bacterium]|nr:response regulator transcription factor [Chloroherpetonaceae bacterium]MDW8436970.1 response regulator transcription factor [Chloroherpetonaceae bacterium]
MTKILLIEDDRATAAALKGLLQFEGYEVVHCEDGKKGYDAALAQSPDLLLLDWMLPNKSGIDICKELRQNHFSQPILMLTCKPDTNEKISALKTGADDYVTKPFDIEELAARIRALLRRVERSPLTKTADEIARGSFLINHKTRRAYYDGKSLKLTQLEFKLLVYLLEREGEALSYDDLMKDVWKVVVQEHTIRQRVSILRQKIGDDPNNPKHIFTLHGHGYRFSSVAQSGE